MSASGNFEIYRDPPGGWEALSIEVDAAINAPPDDEDPDDRP